MTIALTHSEFENLMVQAYVQGEPIYEPTELGYQLQMPQQIGQGNDCVLRLRGGLIINVRNFQLPQTLELIQCHGEAFPITAKFYLSGGSRVKTPSVPGVAPDYEELAGHSYLYHLPDLTEVEDWQATQPIQLVMLSADVNYFQGLGITDSAGLWSTYEIQQGDLQGLGVGLGVNYVGNREGDLANTFEVEDYFLTNAALFYKRDNWRFGLNFNNLFDVEYIRVTNNRSFGNIPGAPFSVVGSVSVTF